MGCWQPYLPTRLCSSVTAAREPVTDQLCIVQTEAPSGSQTYKAASVGHRIVVFGL